MIGDETNSGPGGGHRLFVRKPGPTDAPHPLQRAISGLNMAIQHLRQVVEHRGGAMLPFEEITIVGICDNLELIILPDHAMTVKVRAARHGEYSRLIKLLEANARDRAWPPLPDDGLSSSVAVSDLAQSFVELVAKMSGGANVKIDDDVAGVAIVGGEKLDVAAAGAIARPDADRAVGEVQSGAVAHGDSPVEITEPSR
jgi:hypothetical protein